MNALSEIVLIHFSTLLSCTCHVDERWAQKMPLALFLPCNFVWSITCPLPCPACLLPTDLPNGLPRRTVPSTNDSLYVESVRESREQFSAKMVGRKCIFICSCRVQGLCQTWKSLRKTTNFVSISLFLLTLL